MRQVVVEKFLLSVNIGNLSVVEKVLLSVVGSLCADGAFRPTFDDLSMFSARYSREHS